MRIPIFLALAVALTCQAQQVSGPKADLVQARGSGLKIVVIQGEGAQNNIRSGAAAPLVVEVRDDADKPVPKAEVVFELPPAGPSGVFFGWLRNQTARTDAAGRAETTGFTPNSEAGRFQIKISATSGNNSGGATITQTNSVNGSSGSNGTQMKSGHSGLWKVLLIVGAAGLTAGIIAATRGGSSSETPPVPVTVSAGPVTIGGPR